MMESFIGWACFRKDWNNGAGSRLDPEKSIGVYIDNDFVRSTIFGFIGEFIGLWASEIRFPNLPSVLGHSDPCG
jgi:hypothetical protein